MTNEIKLDNNIGKEKAPKKRKIASLDKRKARVGWIFVLPFLVGFAFVYLPIVGESFWLAFNQLTIVKGGFVYLQVSKHYLILGINPTFLYTFESVLFAR